MHPQVEIKPLPFLPLALFRGSPSREITLYSKGKILRAGPGLSGMMVTTSSSLTSVPTGTESFWRRLGFNLLALVIILLWHVPKRLVTGR